MSLTITSRELISSLLHHTGCNVGALPAARERQLRQFIVGNPDASLDVVYDWSFVRDASDEVLSDAVDLVIRWLSPEAFTLCFQRAREQVHGAGAR